MTKRLFLSIGVPDEVRKALSYEADIIDGELSGAVKPRIPGPDTLHFTIIFLDSQEEEAIPNIVKAMREAAAQLPAFEMKITGTGYNPGSREKRMVWAYGEASEAEVLRDSLAEALMRNHVYFPKFREKFVPHITLARFEPTREEELPEIGGEMDVSFRVGSIELMESVLSDDTVSDTGSEYKVIASIDLKDEKA